MSIFKTGLIGKTPPGKFKDIIDHLTRVKKKKPDFPDVFRNNPRQDMAGGGMLVQPGFGGTRQAYGAAKGSGIKLSAEQIKKLEENLSSEEFKKLDFDRTGVKADQVNYGIGQRNDKRLFRKVVNILKP